MKGQSDRPALLGRGRATIGVSVASALLLGASILYAPVVVAFLLPASLGLALLMVLCYLCRDPNGSSRSHRLLAWAVGAFIVHLVLGVAINASDAAVRAFGPDARTYHDLALGLAEHWKGAGSMPRLPGGREGYFYTLGALYFALGAYAVAGLALNAAFSAALVPLTYDTTRRLFGPAAARRVLPLVVLLPGMLVWTSQLLREAGILFFMGVVVNCAVRLTQRFRPGALIAFVLALVALFSYRGNVAYMLAAGLLAGMVFGRGRIVTGVSTSLTAVGLLAVVIVVVGVGYSGYKLATEANLEQVNVVRTDLSRSAESGFAPGADVSTGDRALAFLPKGTVEFLFGPFPWQARNSRQWLGVVDAAVVWALIPSMIHGVRLGRRRAGRRISVLLLPAALLTVMLSLIIGNYGTIVRERLQVLILLLPFLGLGLAARRDKLDTPRILETDAVAASVPSLGAR